MSLHCALPNTRLKLAARVDYGMSLSSARRSLGVRLRPTNCLLLVWFGWAGSMQDNNRGGDVKF